MDTRLILLLGGLGSEAEVLLAAAGRWAAPVVLLDPALIGLEGPAPLDRPLPAAAAWPAESRIFQARPAACPSELPLERALAAGEGSSVAALAEVLREDMRRDQKLARSAQRPWRLALERRLVVSFRRGLLHRLLRRRLTRLESLADLSGALGRPKTILCLGNGPSSEDPRLATLDHDCLFRVNHSWRARGYMTEARMVFTGGKATIEAIGAGLFGLFSAGSEARLLPYLALAALKRPLGYLVVEGLGLFLSEPAWRQIRPTNGAAMLATAVALQPDRLIISGVDLFSHPGGSYPGDSATPNAYTPGHDADSELAILMEALSRYRGELVILSDALAEAWARHQKQESAHAQG